MNIPTDRWAALLTSLTDKDAILLPGPGKIAMGLNGQRTIENEGYFFSDVDIQTITRNKTSQNISSGTLKKILIAFEGLIQQKETEKSNILPSLKHFSTKIAIWANNHTTVAKILCYVSFGLFRHFWNKGQANIQAAEKIDGSILSLTSLKDHLKQQLISIEKPRNVIQDNNADNEATIFLPNVLFRLVLDYVSQDDFHRIVKWKPALDSLKELDKRRWKLVESYQSDIIKHLIKDKFTQEIEQIYQLKTLLEADRLFNDSTSNFAYREHRIFDEISKILPFHYFKAKKKYRDLLHNKYFARLVIKTNERHVRDSALTIMPEALKKDKDILLTIAETERSRQSIDSIPEDLKEDKEILLAFIKWLPEAINCTKQHINDRKFILEAVQTNGLVIRYLPQIFKQDREIALAAVQNNGLALEFVAENLRTGDQEIILAALTNTGHAFQYIIGDLKNDHDIILAALHDNINIIPQTLLNDKNFMLKAVAKNGLTLEKASPALKKDKEVVGTAVKQSGRALHYADESFKDNYEIVFAAIEQDPDFFVHVSKTFKNNFEIALTAVRGSRNAYQYISEELKENEIILEAALEHSGEALRHTSVKLRDNKQLVLKAVETINCFKYASNELRGDREVLLKALNVDCFAIEFASPELQADDEINQILKEKKYPGPWQFYNATYRCENEEEMLVRMKEDCPTMGHALAFASDQLRSDKNFLLKALKQNAQSAWGISYVSEDLKKDRDLALAAISVNEYVFESIAHLFRNDIGVIVAAVKQNDYMLRFLSEDMQKNPEVLAAIEE